MKTIIVLIVSLIIVFSSTGCTKQDSYRDETKQMTMDVYNCLLEGDTEKLKSLF